MSDATEATEADLRFGTTIRDALGSLEKAGFSGSFRVVSTDAIECLTCHEQSAPGQVRMEEMWRIEGVSDPDDEESVLGLVCPRCHAKGTLILNYGAKASPEESAVFVRMEDRRKPRR